MPNLLFTTYWDEPIEARRRDILLALDGNRDSFDKVFVLSQQAKVAPEQHRNCYWSSQLERQTFRKMLQLAADNAGLDDIAIIANSDIWIPSSTLAVINWHLQANEAYCLSRWDILPKGITLFDRADSQDTWVFRGPPRVDIDAGFPFGFPGVDNRFAAELQIAGYRVLNPSRDVKTYHIHPTPHRNGNKPENRVGLPYLFVKPAKLGDEPEYSVPTKISKRAGHFQR